MGQPLDEETKYDIYRYYSLVKMPFIIPTNAMESLIYRLNEEADTLYAIACNRVKSKPAS